MIGFVKSVQGRRVLAVCALGAMTACAAAQATRRQPATIVDGKLTPARPPVPTYGPNPALTCPTGGVYGELATQLAKMGSAPVPQDGQLCAVAEALLGWKDEKPPSDDVLAFVARHFGLTQAPAFVPAVTLQTEDPRQVAQRLAETISGFASRYPEARYGIASERIAPKRRPGAGERVQKDVGATRVVLVLRSATVQLDEVPRRLDLGQKAVISGKLAGDLENPKVLVSDALGKLATVEQPPGKAFKAEVACGDKPGRIVVAIHAEEMGNERPMTTFPIGCGTELPASIAVGAQAWPQDPAAQARKIGEEINAERAAAGLKPLEWSEPVANVARAASENLRESAKGGGTPKPLNITELLAEADLAAPVVLQNPAQAADARAAHERLLTSPVHRANMMSPEVTHFGIGVAPVPAAGDAPASAFITQLFVKVPPPVDVSSLRDDLREAIAKRRVAEKAAPLQTEKALDDLAQRWASDLAASGGNMPAGKSDDIGMKLSKAYKGINVLSGAKVDPLDFAQEDTVVGKGKALGIGVAQGRHPTLGKNATYVVILLATPRK